MWDFVLENTVNWILCLDDYLNKCINLVNLSQFDIKDHACLLGILIQKRI